MMKQRMRVALVGLLAVTHKEKRRRRENKKMSPIDADQSRIR